tara:strand:+ start:679 stop:822 length:144 start_codon:yes stop_codon:yes gene_type:complete
MPHGKTHNPYKSEAKPPKRTGSTGGETRGIFKKASLEKAFGEGYKTT